MASILFFFFSVLAFGVFSAYARGEQDTEPPMIRCESELLEISVRESDLLQGVSAYDQRSGDVSDSLVVERLSPFTEDGKRSVTYAATDKKNNVGRVDRTVTYTDYEEPKFSFVGPLSFREGGKVDILPRVRASGSLDGDLTDNIKASLTREVNINVPGSYPVELRVSDSAGKIVFLEVEIEIYERKYAGIAVTLREYLLYLERGSLFDPESYFQESSAQGELKVESTVDTSVPGIYNVDFFVEGTSDRGVMELGKSRLVVIVE